MLEEEGKRRERDCYTVGNGGGGKKKWPAAGKEAAYGIFIHQTARKGEKVEKARAVVSNVVLSEKR